MNDLAALPHSDDEALPAVPAVREVSNSDFLRACRGLPLSRRPIWFMRQAGRALPEYRRVRADIPMLQACTMPELVAEITLQPVRRYGVDAAILFSDIVVPLKAVGVGVEIVPGVGPVIEKPIASMTDVEQMRVLHASDVEFVARAVEILVAELGSVPLIGFAGAPFTLASYLVEGGPSREHLKTKQLMYSRPDIWHALLDRLAEISAEFLRVQVAAGASAVQLFDSWAGTLSPQDYCQFVLPHSTKVLAALGGSGVPRIHFGVGTGELLALMGDAGADVVGVDWRVPLDAALGRVGARAVQGNLDPAVVLSGWDAVETATRDVLHRGQGAKGHIFNLGHGVLPSTDPDVLTRLVEFVHNQPPESLGG